MGERLAGGGVIERGSGGRRSFDMLFDAHYARLVRHLSVAAGSREAAEDAVQEAFAQAHVRWEEIASYDDPSGWVRRVALNRIRNRHRGFRRLLAAKDRLTDWVEPDDDQFARWIDRADVARALITLSARQRQAVSLYYLEGLPVAEVAAEMDVSQGSVKTHLHRAREALSQLLKEAP